MDYDPGFSDFYIQGCYWEHKVRTGNLSPKIIGPPPYIRCLCIGPYWDNFASWLSQGRCEFYYDDSNHTEVSTSNIIGVRLTEHDAQYKENKARPYTFYCKPPNLDIRVPKAVTYLTINYINKKFTFDYNGHLRKWMQPILGNFGGYPTIDKNELMVCVKPLVNGPFKEYQYIVSFLATLHAMGGMYIYYKFFRETLCI